MNVIVLLIMMKGANCSVK